MLDMTDDQLLYFAQHVPLIEARKHYPLAKLMSAILNFMGGKGEIDEHGNEVKSKKPTKPERLLYTPEEVLVWYASFGDSGSTPRVSMTPATAQDIMDNLLDMPAWALSLAPIDEAKRVLGRT